MRAALLLALTLSLATEAQAKCAMLSIVPAPLTPGNTAIATGGGIVVGLTYQGQGRNDDKVEQPTWRIKQGGKTSEPKIKVLAPGLAVYEITGDGVLVDGKGKSLVAVKKGKELPKLATPTLKTAAATSDQGTSRWGSSSTLEIETTADAPAGVVGVIVYQAGKPVQWEAFEKDGSKRAARFREGGHCANDLPGTSVPTTGDVTVAWFDASGRVSAPSAPVAIKLTKP